MPRRAARPAAIQLAPGRPGVLFDGPSSELVNDPRQLLGSGLAHWHAHQHGGELHAHVHVHDAK